LFPFGQVTAYGTIHRYRILLDGLTSYPVLDKATDDTDSRNDAPLGKSLVGEEKLPRMGLPSKCVLKLFSLVFESRQE
jgi:hypothetical protein